MTRGKVLIVDDDLISRETLAEVLESQQCRIAQEASGETAVQRAREFLPDLILLDVMMPGMDGFTVCRILRSDPLTAEIPILLITALDDQKSRLQGIEAGADDFLTKPFNITELQARVRTILRLNRYRQLHNERTKFEHVVQSAETGYIIINSRDEITFANRAAHRYLPLPESGRQRFREVAQRSYEFWQPETWESWPEANQSGQHRYLHHPETEMAQPFWLDVQTLTRLSNPDEDSWIISLTDATDQIKLQQEMQAFHVLVQHKLRTPLVGIYNGLSLLKTHKHTLDEAVRAELLDAAQANAEQLHQEVERIDAFAQTMVRLTPQLMNSYPLKKLRAMLIRLCLKLGINPPNITVPDNVGNRYLPLCAEDLEKVFGELLQNAQKFHPRQSPHITIEIIDNGEEVCVLVKDDGVHLPPEQLANAWRPYYQGEKRFTGQIAGMGIGLPTVGNIVERVNGRCQMRNRPNTSGIIVEICLPISQNEHSESDQPITDE